MNITAKEFEQWVEHGYITNLYIEEANVDGFRKWICRFESSTEEGVIHTLASAKKRIKTWKWLDHALDALKKQFPEMEKISIYFLQNPTD